MLIRDINPGDRTAFNQKAGHPLQSYEWGEFRELTGIKVIRKGIFEGRKLITPIQVTIHPLPKLNYQIGYFPKGPMPDEIQLTVLKQIGQENNCLLIKLEPNVPKANSFTQINQFLLKRGCRPGRPLFTQHTFELNLKPKEDELLKNFHPKTRYNINLSLRKGVKAIVDNSPNSFQWFIKLLFEETTKRQGFFAHTPEYFTKMWQVLAPKGMAHILRAEYQGKTLAAFMAFVFNQKIYYPYGASTRENKELMAPNLLMWELIKLGQKLNCQTLDMWGALGPKPDPNDPWYGFHRFKQGYGASLVEFLGSYDLVLNPGLYRLYRLAEEARWGLLHAKATVKKIPHRLSQTFNSLTDIFSN